MTALDTMAPSDVHIRGPDSSTIFAIAGSLSFAIAKGGSGKATAISAGVAPPRAKADPAAKHIYVQRPLYHAYPPAVYAPPQAAYAPAPRPRRLFRVRKYSDRDTAAYNDILVDPGNPHWTFDPNQWIANNY